MEPNFGNAADENLNKILNIDLKNVLDAIPDPIFVKDQQHRWIYGNLAFQKKLAMRPEEYLGKSDYDLSPVELAQIFWEKDDEVFRSGNQNENEELVKFAGIGERLCLTKKMAIKLDDQTMILVGIIRDIAERRELELRLVNSSKMATLGEMAGGVAHEINNPLAIIKSRLYQVIRELKNEKPDIPKAIEMLSMMDRTADRIESIVKGLRAFSRNGIGDPFLNIDLNLLVGDVLELCEQKIKHKEIKIILNLEPVKVNCRPVQLGQVLLNLLSNAVDAVQDLPEKWIQIQTFVKGNKAILKVIDSGSGISADILGKVFVPFFTTKDLNHGTGLGLSISKGIIDEHKGILFVEKDQLNTTFVIELDLVEY